MGSPADPEKPPGPSRFADAIGGMAVYPARAAARAWREPLETAVEDLLATPEARRVLDRVLSGPLPEEVARSLVRRRVLERVGRELAESGELERLLTEALESPRTLEILDRVLASEVTSHALERIVAGPELRAALTAQSAGLAEQVGSHLREAATDVDRRLSAPASARLPYAGIASRGIALVVDAFVVVAVSAAIGAAAGLVASVVGGVRPQWLAQLLLGLAPIAVAVGYFSLFWTTAGQTLGMRLMHVRVLRSRGDPRLTLWRSLVRTLGLALAILPCFLGFLPALFDSRRRALPDYLADTVVAYDDGDRPPAG